MDNRRRFVYGSIIETIQNNIHRFHEKFLSAREGELKENYRDLRLSAQTVCDKQVTEAESLAKDQVRMFNFYRERKSR